MGRNKEAQKPPWWSYPVFGIIIAVYFVNEQYGTAIVQWWENYWVEIILTIILAGVLIISWRVGLFEIILEYVDKRKEKKREEKLRSEGKEFVFDYPGEEKWLTKEERGEWEARKMEEKRKEEEKWKTDLGKIIKIILECRQLKRHPTEKPYQQHLLPALRTSFPNTEEEVVNELGRPDIEINNDQFAIEIKGPTHMSDLRGAENSVDSKIGKYLRDHEYMIVVLYDIRTKDIEYNKWKKSFFTHITNYNGRLHLIEDTSKDGENRMKLVESVEDDDVMGIFGL